MNKWVVAVLVVVLLVVIYISGSRMLRQEVALSQDQAVTFANEELRYTYPGAYVDIYGVENISASDAESYWKIQAKVIYGRNSICPNLTLVELRYPRFGFVPRERLITDSCRVLGCRNIPNCIIAYPEEAILMPLDPDRNPGLQPDLSRYVDSAGSDNIQASSGYFENYVSNSSTTYKDVWVTRYTAPALPNSFETILNRTGGNALEHYILPKT